MANADQPKGFRPFGKILKIGRYIAAGTIYAGDAVKQDSSGGVVAGTVGALCGVAANYCTSGQDCFVYDDPSQEFIGQMDESDCDAQTDLGLNYSILATAGNATYKTSRMEIDSSTQNTTATLELKVLRLLNTPNNAYGANAECVFKINNHQLGSHTGTAGV